MSKKIFLSVFAALVAFSAIAASRAGITSRQIATNSATLQNITELVSIAPSTTFMNPTFWGADLTITFIADPDAFTLTSVAEYLTFGTAQQIQFSYQRLAVGDDSGNLVVTGVNGRGETVSDKVPITIIYTTPFPTTTTATTRHAFKYIASISGEGLSIDAGDTLAATQTNHVGLSHRFFRNPGTTYAQRNNLKNCDVWNVSGVGPGTGSTGVFGDLNLCPITDAGADGIYSVVYLPGNFSLTDYLISYADRAP